MRVLRWYLSCSTLLYTIGVALTVLPPFLSSDVERITANITGGVIAIVLGVLALGWLAVFPTRTFLPVVVAGVATPVVISFHVMSTAEFICVLGPIFLAVYVRGFYPVGRARLLTAGLTVLTVVAMLISPAPEYPSAYIIVAILIPAAAESFGGLTSSLLSAACTDPLTGLLNRAGWELQTAARLQSRRRPQQTALVALDIDDFKTVNDRLGHAAGDRRLVAVAHALREVFPEAIIARSGGDEFTVLIDAATAEHTAELSVLLAGRLPDVSAGWAFTEEPDIDIRALGERADADLRVAKAQRMRRSSRPAHPTGPRLEYRAEASG
ncbi:MAG: diguanylate cyclase [Gordonia sp. (in: high G+C Gram-positive bacteria)]|uniref:GGDEF domain-containing protein n=1 Tax=Gordonia TaxID=2053 RepID=UPI003267092D